MKKHLIAAAVAAAVAVPAMAQVTISGRVDASIGAASNILGADDTRVTSGLLSTPQITISGSEDLGGGLKANLFINSGITTDAGGALDLGSRGFTVGISGGFGAVTIGKDSGSAIDQIATSSVVNNLGNYTVLNNRVTNSISYTSPAINGFTGRIIYTAGNDTLAADVEKYKNQVTELSASYANGPLMIRAANSVTKDASFTAVTSGAANIFGSSVNVVAGAATKVTESGVMVNYNFGVAAVNARYIDRSVKGGSGSLVDQDATGIGVSVPLGNGLTANVDIWKLDSVTANADYDVTSATLVKELSKRTNIYGAYSSKDNEATASKTESVFAIGVRHSF
jgi:general bacterial porin, GBP family